MKHLIAFLLFLFSLPALAASPTASLVTSRTSGTAPLCVHFDATGSTDADVASPFRDLLYRWNFGNPNAGNWPRGANTSLPKNQARGAVAVHCYETAGSYTAKLQVCDATSCVSTSQAITVTAADTTFSGTNTTCFYNATLGTGCPAGATQTASSDFDAALAACAASGKRCLFKGGDTFAVSATTGLTGTIATLHLGSYGTGRAIVSVPVGVPAIYLNSASISDMRVVGLEFVGPYSAPGTGSESAMQVRAAVTDITVMDNVFRGLGGNVGMSDFNVATGFFHVGNSLTAYTKGNAAYLHVHKAAFLGNFVDDSQGEHGLRVQFGRKMAISHNYFGSAQTAKGQLTVRSYEHNTGAAWDDGRDTQYVYVSDNYFDNTSPAPLQVGVAPSDDTSCEWGREFVLERNFIKAGVYPASTLTTTQRIRATWRNNIVLADPSTSTVFSVNNSSNNTCSTDQSPNPANAMPAPDDNRFENNTIYHPGTRSELFVGRIDGLGTYPAKNTTFRNSLTYAPSVGTVYPAWNINSPVGTTAETNSTNAQSKVSPSFAATPTTPIHFRPAVAAYATNGGTASFPATAEDFLLCRDRTGAVRMGALVPAARAQCAGVAGAP